MRYKITLETFDDPDDGDHQVTSRSSDDFGFALSNVVREHLSTIAGSYHGVNRALVDLLRELDDEYPEPGASAAINSLIKVFSPAESPPAPN